MDIYEFIAFVREILFENPTDERAEKIKNRIAKAIDWWKKQGMLD